MELSSLTILIPAKDEEKRLPSFLETVILFAQKFSRPTEIIVINDGSQDQTPHIVRSFQNQYDELKLINFPTNRGKGYALKQGMFAAKGEVIVFLDADGSTPVDEINRHLHLLKKGFDIIIGSRVLADNHTQVKVRTHRKWIGKTFNALVHLLLIKDIQDTQCGFKMFKRSIVHNLFGRLYLDGFGADLEILYVAKQLGLSIKEVAVNWHHVDGSKVNLIKDSLEMLNNIFQIKSWHPMKLTYPSPHMSINEIKTMARVEDRHWWFIAKSIFMKKILACLPRPRKTLDAGCGTGSNAQFLRKTDDYVGVDAIKEALLYSQRRQLPNLIQSDLKQLGFKDNSFDRIVCLDVIEHIDDDRQALNELKRLLSPHGTLILAVPAFRNMFSSHDIALSHMRRYNRQDLNNLIKDCDLDIQEVSYAFAFAFLPAYLWRRLQRLFPFKKEIKSDTHSMPPAFLNSLLIRLSKAEAVLKKFLPLPFGTTLIAIIRKKASPAHTERLLDHKQPLVEEFV